MALMMTTEVDILTTLSGLTSPSFESQLSRQQQDYLCFEKGEISRGGEWACFVRSPPKRLSDGKVSTAAVTRELSGEYFCNGSYFSGKKLKKWMINLIVC
jgi:hypothetical protein